MFWYTSLKIGSRNKYILVGHMVGLSVAENRCIEVFLHRIAIQLSPSENCIFYMTGLLKIRNEAYGHTFNAYIPHGGDGIRIQ